MRESNFTFPHQNRAVVSISHMLYDRRALDTSSTIALLNNLTSLTYLTSTSPRIREILTVDGGLERLLDILRESTLPRQYPTVPDMWGLNGPCTARVISLERQVSLRHSLAFQCVVNIGVRGSEAIRTRVVQAGALDLVAQILESWLIQFGVGISAGPIGSQAVIDAQRQGLPAPGAEPRRRARSASSRQVPPSVPQPGQSQALPPNPAQSQGQGQTWRLNGLPPLRASTLANFIASLSPRNARNALAELTRVMPSPNPESEPSRNGDTDVDMADGEGEGEAGTETDGQSIGPDESMEVDEPMRGEAERPAEELMDPNPNTTTPRASMTVLPLAMAIPPRGLMRETVSQASSTRNSFSDTAENVLPRTGSESNLAAGSQQPRAAPLNLSVARLPQLAADANSNQSSPVGTLSRPESAQGRPTRRDTIVARPLNLHLAPRNERNRGDAGSEASDVDGDVDMETATIAANVAAVQEQNLRAGTRVIETRDGMPDGDINVALIPETGQPEEPDVEAMAAEQARLDMEAGAPPGQPGAAETPRVTPGDVAVPDPQLAVANGQEQPAAPAQIIIANGAPRGFQDLGSYVGIISLLNPNPDQYSEDSILLSLQLLAYLSKYPHVRNAFHHPRRPMHATFDLYPENMPETLPERPATSRTPNIFSLVERFTFRPSPSDPRMFKIPSEIQYWAGVIMRNACRKDDARGGIRQCAHMSCGRWEKSPREFAKCRRCRKAKYCSKECQSRAWQEGHRFWCSARTDPEPGQPAPPPGDTMAAAGADDDEADEAFPNMRIPREVLMRMAAARAAQAGEGTGGTTGILQRQQLRARQAMAEEAGEAEPRPGRRDEREPRGIAQPAAFDPLLPADLQTDLLREMQGGRQERDTRWTTQRTESTLPLWVGASTLDPPGINVGRTTGTSPSIPPRSSSTEVVGLLPLDAGPSRQSSISRAQGSAPPPTSRLQPGERAELLRSVPVSQPASSALADLWGHINDATPRGTRAGAGEGAGVGGGAAEGRQGRAPGVAGAGSGLFRQAREAAPDFTNPFRR